MCVYVCDSVCVCVRVCVSVSGGLWVYDCVSAFKFVETENQDQNMT